MSERRVTRPEWRHICDTPTFPLGFRQADRTLVNRVMDIRERFAGVAPTCGPRPQGRTLLDRLNRRYSWRNATRGSTQLAFRAGM